MKEWGEYAAVWAILNMLGVLPRGLARGLAAAVASALYGMLPKLRRTAEFNLRLAFPEWDDERRRDVIRGMVRNLGWMAAEFAHFPRYTRENIEEALILDGHENFLNGQRRGKGVLYLTGHIGAWELSSFAHALYGFPLHYMARPLDNARVRHRGDFGRPKHHAGRGRIRGFFWQICVYNHGDCTRCVAHRRRRRARIRVLGPQHREV